MTVFGSGFASAAAFGGHARTFLNVAADGASNRAAVLFRPTLYECLVRLVNLAPGKLSREPPVRFIIFCNDHQAAGSAIETVNNPRPQIARTGRKLLEAVQQGVYESAPIASVIRRAGTCMNHHSRGLVDDGKVVIFINDIERDFLGNRAQGRKLNRADDSDPLAAAKAKRGFGG